ncbi:MAG: UDP-N-acetylmuramate dehydrogenase [Candidatus Devosia symbiotica]|nr:UDP-N-acetylmuramate dehydrogenase [Candidatus Devosia symbiotica]
MNQSLLHNYDLAEHNTFRLAAQSDFARTIVDEAELLSLFALVEQRELPVRILGEGNNVILSERYSGITVLMATRGREIAARDEDTHIVEAHAGENWHELVAHTVAQGLWGLENLAGIPGTVGAAPVQNIGAYGIELSDRFVSLRAFDRQFGAFVELDGPSCRFAYRHSLFKEQRDRYVVTRVRLLVSKSARPTLSYRELSDIKSPDQPAVIMEKVLQLRRAKIPDWRRLGNVGSFFHNPVVSEQIGRAFMADNPAAPAFIQADGTIKLSAGWLIEHVGLKGYRQGPVGVSDQHALVLVNHGGASSGDVLRLAEYIVTTVRDRFGIGLQREPELL